MINVIELFAGVGGFRIGLEKMNHFQVVWGNQWEPSKKAQDAFHCYAQRFQDKGVHCNKDIATVTDEEIQQIDAEMIVGGFPCQDYSVARSLSGEKGIQGKKGVLFWEIKRLVNIKRPKYVLLENVDRLLKSPSKQRGRDFSVMLATFRDLGYHVEWRVINAAEYGQAQRRRRIFIFAYRNDIPYAITHKDETDYSLLHHKGFFAVPFPVQTESSPKHPAKELELPFDIVDVSDDFSAGYWNAGIMRDGRIYTAQLIPIEESPIPLGFILEKNVDDTYYLSETAIEKFEYLKGPKKIERTAASGHKYIFSEGGMSFPELLDKPGRTMLTSEASINRSTHVVKDEKGFRFLTPIECERLNGFPDDWTNTGMSNRMRYFCMGNALVVGLIERMAERVYEIDNISVEKLENEFEEEMV
ncbi:DNA (cytosine-5-)-methyltransferase [Bacillus toyonensis]|uniref:DNA (cytosine-5-)-methyltransferase n=1 Tax=Bacillus toyonensis TaxID=155322 RepID=UPI000BEF3CC3|nr:DNA (cytosine-5-)-methyltransferase [Bacillus toyonensis]PEL01352.1 DNA (cytosine-5-)-methyltransferase [Bacillus toyonensis]